MPKTASEVTLLPKNIFSLKILNFVQSFVERKVSLADGTFTCVVIGLVRDLLVFVSCFRLQRLLLDNLKPSESSTSTGNKGTGNSHESICQKDDPADPGGDNRSAIADEESAVFEKLAKSISSVALFSALADETFRAYVIEDEHQTSTEDYSNCFTTPAASDGSNRLFKQPSLVARKPFDPREHLTSDDGPLATSSDSDDHDDGSCSSSQVSSGESEVLELISPSSERLAVELKLEIISNWGDTEFCGLRKVELFDGSGERYCFDENSDQVEVRINTLQVICQLVEKEKRNGQRTNSNDVHKPQIKEYIPR